MRCKWVNEKNEIYLKYHDEEWGVPSYDDKYLFEMLILESFQAGLSWECILNKRENFREDFDNFDYAKISNYDEKKIEELKNNAGIVRNGRKIIAAINNAKIFMQIQKEFGSFSKYIWGFTDGQVIDHHLLDGKDMPAKDELSELISADLKKRGFKFVGPTTVYSYLQGIGIINDHWEYCDYR